MTDKLISMPDNSSYLNTVDKQLEKKKKKVVGQKAKNLLHLKFYIKLK